MMIPENAPLDLPWVEHRRDVADAATLIATFGARAGDEAAARADRSRDLGNHIHFCRWRQIERLIAVLAEDRPIGTIH